jgi:hypothetical protein
VGIVRKLVAFVLALAVQGAVLTGPFVHAHPDSHDTGHHRGAAVHTHWAGHAAHAHSSDTSAIDTEDHDRAVFLNSFVAVAGTVHSVPAVSHSLFVLPVPVERPARRGIEVVRSHDPPCLRSLSSRAPPALLS